MGFVLSAKRSVRSTRYFTPSVRSGVAAGLIPWFPRLHQNRKYSIVFFATFPPGWGIFVACVADMYVLVGETLTLYNAIGIYTFTRILFDLAQSATTKHCSGELREELVLQLHWWFYPQPGRRSARGARQYK
jgi:hypothetical protein